MQSFYGSHYQERQDGPSPQWLVDRLEAIGERSINNVADITNYVMHELGQPMHAFDLDKLAGGRIIVRHTKDAETITTLDEVDRTLNESMLAICDGERPAAVAGIMGGLATSISDDTVNVLLEVAYFDRVNIRATSRKLNLATEASYRFERGVDVENLVNASNRATQLICDLAGGTAGDLIDVYPVTNSVNSVESNDISGAVKRLTGLTVSKGEWFGSCLPLAFNQPIRWKMRKARGLSFRRLRGDTTSPSRRISSRRSLGMPAMRILEPNCHPAYGAGDYQAT